MSDLSLYEGSCFKIRATSFEEALCLLKEKWAKVIQDCQSAIEEGRDTSSYRKEYLLSHQSLLSALDFVLNPEDLLSFKNSLDNSKSDAQEDAYTYAYIEICSILDQHHG